MNENELLFTFVAADDQLQAVARRAQKAITDLKKDGTTTAPAEHAAGEEEEKSIQRKVNMRRALGLVANATGGHVAELMHMYHAYHMLGGPIGVAAAAFFLLKSNIDTVTARTKELQQVLKETMDDTTALFDKHQRTMQSLGGERGKAAKDEVAGIVAKQMALWTKIQEIRDDGASWFTGARVPGSRGEAIFHPEIAGMKAELQQLDNDRVAAINRARVVRPGGESEFVTAQKRLEYEAKHTAAAMAGVQAKKAMHELDVQAKDAAADEYLNATEGADKEAARERAYKAAVAERKSAATEAAADIEKTRYLDQPFTNEDTLNRTKELAYDLEKKLADEEASRHTDELKYAHDADLAAMAAQEHAHKLARIQKENAEQARQYHLGMSNEIFQLQNQQITAIKGGGIAGLEAAKHERDLIQNEARLHMGDEQWEDKGIEAGKTYRAKAGRMGWDAQKQLQAMNVVGFSGAAQWYQSFATSANKPVDEQTKQLRELVKLVGVDLITAVKGAAGAKW